MWAARCRCAFWGEKQKNIFAPKQFFLTQKNEAKSLSRFFGSHTTACCWSRAWKFAFARRFACSVIAFAAVSFFLPPKNVCASKQKRVCQKKEELLLLLAVCTSSVRRRGTSDEREKLKASTKIATAENLCASEYDSSSKYDVVHTEYCGYTRYTYAYVVRRIARKNS